MGEEADADWQDGLVEWGLASNDTLQARNAGFVATIAMQNDLIRRLGEHNAKMARALERKQEMRAGELDALDKIIAERDAALEQNAKLVAALGVVMNKLAEFDDDYNVTAELAIGREALQQSTEKP